MSSLVGAAGRPFDGFLSHMSLSSIDHLFSWLIRGDGLKCFYIFTHFFILTILII